MTIPIWHLDIPLCLSFCLSQSAFLSLFPSLSLCLSLCLSLSAFLSWSLSLSFFFGWLRNMLIGTKCTRSVVLPHTALTVFGITATKETFKKCIMHSVYRSPLLFSALLFFPCLFFRIMNWAFQRNPYQMSALAWEAFHEQSKCMISMCSSFVVWVSVCVHACVWWRWGDTFGFKQKTDFGKTSYLQWVSNSFVDRKSTRLNSSHL